MNTGAYISGAAHLLFVAFLLFSGLFSRDNFPPLEVAEVSLISAEDFALLTVPDAAPQTSSEPATLVAPAPEAQTSATPSEDTPPTIQQPPAPEAPEPPAAPQEDVTETPAPPPLADILPDEPEIIAPPTVEDGTDMPLDETPAPADRVAPEPAAPTDQAVDAAPEVIEETAPEPEPEAPVEQQDAAAPEEATTEIVTEAEQPVETAPTKSVRPRSRPARAPQVAETPATAPEEDTTAAAVAAAVAEAVQDDTPTPAAPTGPPLTSGEKDALRIAVQQCWNVGSLSSDALRTTIVVGVAMNVDGTPDNGSIKLIGSEGGSDNGTRQAFEAARRAIIRCGARGYNLPVDKYDQWRTIEITFNPERMRIK